MIGNIKKAVKHSSIYGLGNISIKLVGLILFPIYTKHISIADYGVLGILEVTAQFLVTIFGLNMYSAIFRLYFDNKQEKDQKQMIGNTLGLLFVVCVLVFLAFVSLSDSISVLLFKKSDYALLVQLVSVSAGLEILNTIPATVLRIEEKPVLYSATQLVKITLSLVLTIYFIVYLHLGIKGIYFALIIGQVAYFLTLSPYFFKRISFKINIPLLKEMLIFSLPLMISAVSRIVLTIADRYCIQFIDGSVEVGLYTAGYKIANVLMLVSSSIQLAITPMFYKKINDADNKRFYAKITTYLTFIIMFMALGLSLFSKEVIVLMARNKDYYDAYKIIPIISFSIIFGMLRYTSTIGLGIVKKTTVIGTITIIISILTVGLNLLLIPYFHSYGAACATLISQIAYFYFTYIKAQKYYFIHYELKRIFLILFIGLLIIGPSFILNNIDLGLRIFIKALLILSFPVILYFLRFYEEIELQRISEAWKKWRNPSDWLKNIRNIKL